MRGRAAAVLAVCWLAACGNGGDGAASGEGTAEDGSPATATSGEGAGQGGEADMPVQPITRPDQTVAAGTISPVNNSGVTGSVNLRGIGEQTEVSLNVTGITEGNQQLQAAVVQGTCAQSSGPEVAQIGPIPVGAGNVGALTDTLAVPPGTVLNGQHALIIKGQNAGPSTPPLACAALPEWQRLPSTG